MIPLYDVIVVGGGHAGCEACLATSKMGLHTLLVTGNLNMVGSMPCNPSIGGPAKGVVVREIDALGGYMGKNADLCQIQTKMLNSSKGPAVRALRFQEDKLLYMATMKKHLEQAENLDLLEMYVEDLIVEENQVKGIVLEDGKKVEAKVVILTTGTYLDSRILRGHWTSKEGPDGQKTSRGLSAALKRLGFEIQRLKTGTPPRIKASSIDFTKTKLEPGDDITWKYSFDEGYSSILNKRIPCYLTYTTKEIHDLILANLKESAMYGGVVEGIGPRYCPSIEDKVVKFSDKERHQIFFEPESLSLDQEYIQGFSTSMPVEIQDKMIRMLPGLENCEVIRYAYAIEYDAINPLDIKPSLETKKIENLFTAGQINGTSGYEEAAGQGLIAGINAGRKIKGKEPLILSRDEAYIGVMIDDLVTKGTNEPYRLLTSRAEYRLLLRHDNADLRLREYGYESGLIDKDTYQRLVNKKTCIEKFLQEFKDIKIKPTEETNAILNKVESSPIVEGTSLYSLLKRPEISYLTILQLYPNLEVDYSNRDEVLEQVEIDIKYEGYISKALSQAQKMRSYDAKKIPLNIDYDLVDNIAIEAREKLKKIRPITIGQASRISGVNPADISVLVVYIENLKNK
ncbi:MAG: tRNA uridine-5-carboxymethylaminomethyl(34) synthesis enzyme MnmG [Roseburia sp.]|nr:tRNA uridine-5-carboxymethylaminomethyl(34) synthesis enzyme MnmG [Anaeroplasma bactoclasticum]MCM1196390.1 tRNA uridine-5-carboxymethylaminomethyl(34) synthesis enzyme MnmG [Roseburia sp.]MCM1556156.1 tRNA uridine-5-carboxymethylaminomethyl(34) synthesis enzyme MnmG [Anaeroplasma bactoclasticum]